MKFLAKQLGRCPFLSASALGDWSLSSVALPFPVQLAIAKWRENQEFSKLD